MAVKMFKKRAVDAGVAVFIIAAILHFAHRGVQGESGFFTHVAVDREARALMAERRALQEERAQLENLNHRLSERYLDLDLLDERARDVLGLVRESEVVIR